MASGRSQPELQGRAEALGSVAQAIEGALRGGEGGLVILEGEAGIGKSRLIGEAATLARASGMAVAVGAADPLALSRPFGALIDALALTPSADEPDRARLGELLFGDVAGSGPGQPDVQYLVQEGLIALLERQVTAQPLLLALDDLQ